MEGRRGLEEMLGEATYEEVGKEREEVKEEKRGFDEGDC